MFPRADFCSRRGRHGLSFRVGGRCQCRALTFHEDAGLSTKQRILDAALELFNAEGVAALSAVDIATALSISPGHLYYHFKGKPEILGHLADAYQNEVDLVLEAALEACQGPGATLETLWTHVHILAEEAWDARFLYREAGALALRHPDLAARIRRIAAAEREALRAMLTAMETAGAIAASAEVIDGLSRLMTTGISFHAIQLELEGDPGPPRARVARAAAQIMLLPAGLVRAI
jgi:AcrR family transcriptional regulator